MTIFLSRGPARDDSSVATAIADAADPEAFVAGLGSFVATVESWVWLMVAASTETPIADGDLDPVGSNWVLVVVILLCSILLARFVQWASYRYLANVDAETTLGRAAFSEVHTPFAITIGLLGVYLSLLVLDLLDSTPTVVALISTALIVLWARASIRIGRRWIDVLQEGYSYEFAPMFGNLWTVTVVVGAVLLLVSVWNLTVTPFLASAGILGIVLGFAAQDAIGNLIGGLALYVDNTYKIGDVIRIEDEMRGTVTDVGIRSTTVLTEDNLLVTVPNAMLNSTQVVNECATASHAASNSDYGCLRNRLRDGRTTRPRGLRGVFVDSRDADTEAPVRRVRRLRAGVRTPGVHQPPAGRTACDRSGKQRSTTPSTRRESRSRSHSGS